MKKTVKKKKKPDPEVKNWTDQLMLLKSLTATTGVIHEAQRFNIKQWGAVAFQDLGKWRAEMDAEKKSVSYFVEGKKKTPELPALIAAVVRSINWLLGDDWAVMVYQSDNLLFDGKSLSRENAKRKPRAST